MSLLGLGEKILFLLVDLLKSWPFVFLLVVAVFYKQLKEFLAKINIFKLNKDGLVLEKTMQEAKETLSDLKELACTMYIPLLNMLTRYGRLSGAISIEERVHTRNSIEEFISKNDIKDPKLLNMIDSLNNSIIHDALYSITKTNTTRSPFYADRKLFLNTEIRNDHFYCTPNIEAIKDKCIKENLMDETISYILEEVGYFIENKSFKDLSKINKLVEELDD